MPHEGLRKYVFFSEDRVLESNDILELMFAKQCSARIHLQAGSVIVPPPPQQIVIFQDKPKGIDLFMAARTLRVTAVLFQFLPNRQTFLFEAFRHPPLSQECRRAEAREDR